MADNTCTQEPKEPKLRHEFVGMMFAVTIGEVGLQVAALIHHGHWVHYLPAYSHLFLATIIVAASWVGWSLSPSLGARQDVVHVLHLGFVVLVTDVFLVVVYFILVRSVEFGAEQVHPYIAPVSTVTSWIAVMFGAYLFWDLITKLPFFYKVKWDKAWWRDSGTRIAATLLCLILTFYLKHLLGDPDRTRYVAADFALLWLVLLFRALKDICSAFFPSKAYASKELSSRKKQAVLWTLVCIAGIVIGVTREAAQFPLTAKVIQEIEKEPLVENENATPCNLNEPAVPDEHR